MRPDGIPGLTVDEVAVRGIVQNRGAFVAMVQAPDGKSYTVRPGDRLFDGVVKAVTSTAVIFVQQVNDPLSLVKQREIRKPLRPTEEGK
jgi:Tfp pilus assembly protein PilP